MVTVLNESGKRVTLLNPAEKGAKFAKELKQGVKRTNRGGFKLKDGKAIKLTKSERAYRSGYLDARKDSSKVFKAKKKRHR